MTRKEYAEFLVPNVLHDKDYYEAKYPERNLDENALVVRIGPSPTGFVHFGTLIQAMAGHNLAKKDRNSTRLNSRHSRASRKPSSD